MLKLVFKEPSIDTPFVRKLIDIDENISNFIKFNKISKTYYNYINDYIEVNFSVEDIGYCVEVKIYKDTAYTETLDDSDISEFFELEILKKENPSKIIEGFKKTKSVKSDIDKSKLDYYDIKEFCYFYPGKGKRVLFGKSSLINKKQGITIEYDLLNLSPESNYFDSSHIRLVILNEPNREFRETKEEIIKAYYRYKYRN